MHDVWVTVTWGLCAFNLGCVVELRLGLLRIVDEALLRGLQAFQGAVQA